ncbi:MAG: hypothetical protein AAGK04_14830, partial [Planctomycetota bacterium]
DLASTPARLRGPLDLIKLMFGGSRKTIDAELIERSIQPLLAWADEDRRRGARVYQTAAGLRYLLIHPPLDPADDTTAALLRSLRSDERYATLCRVQRSFRARLTPKPWRVGVERFNVRYESYRDADPAFVQWLERYREASKGHAVCRLERTIGNAHAEELIARLTDLHDAATGVGLDRPLA